MGDATVANIASGGVAGRHADLWIARGLTLGPVALAFPVAAAAVFGFGADRDWTADLLAVIFSVGLFAGFSTSLWPLPSLRSWGLYLWHRSRHRDPRGVLLCMATAVVHLYSASLYFGTEMLDGLPNVDTTSFLDSWIKFGLANAPWIVLPWFVLYWGHRTLKNLPRD